MAKVFPYMKFLYKMLIFYQKVLYLFGVSTHIDPLLSALGIVLAKKNTQITEENRENNYSVIDDDKYNNNSSSGTGINGNDNKSIVNNVNKSVFSALNVQVLSSVIIGSMMSIRVLEYILRSNNDINPVDIVTNTANNRTILEHIQELFSNIPIRMNQIYSNVFRLFGGNNRSNYRNTNIQSLNAFPTVDYTLIPPPLPSKTKKGCIIPPKKDFSLCPICRQIRVHPCVSTGGYVFCYPCLLNYVRKQPYCPVTAIPCGESEILRLYEDYNVS